MAASEINLNDTVPAAPAGSVNVKWQKGAQSGTDPVYGLPIFPVSANVPVAGGITLTTTGSSGAATLTGSVLNVPNYAGGGGGVQLYTAADVPPVTANAMDDEFTGSALASKWTQVSTGSPALAFFGSTFLQFAQPAIASYALSAIYQTAPVAPYEVTGKFALPSIDENVHFIGLVVRDSATGKMVTVNWQTANFTVECQEYTSPTVGFGTFGTAIQIHYRDWVYLKFKDDGTNFTLSYSLNGYEYFTLATQARTTFTANPNQVGIVWGVNTANSSTVAICDWFRRTL